MSLAYDRGSMLEQRIQQQFFDSADLLYQAAEPLSKSIHDAASAVVGCVTAGGKVLVCADSILAHLGWHLAAGLVGQFERDRPGLAAVWLDGRTAGAGPWTGDICAQLTRQIETLGQPGDVLALCTGAPVAVPAALCAAVIAAAHAREMTVVAFTGAGTLPEPLFETDVQVAIPGDRLARIHEIQLLALHALFDAIDMQLLGEQEES